MLPRVVVAPDSFVAARNPDVSLASTMLLSEAELAVSAILSLASEAVTPAEDALMRASTVLMVSPAFMVILVPLMVNDPAVTCALFSNRGRRFGSELLNAASALTLVGVVLLTAVESVWLNVSDPAENEIERPIASPRYTCWPAFTRPLKLKSSVLF